jgi:DNA-binding response OmpR family regulator
MGGAEFLTALENDAAWKDLPVAMLSAARVETISPMIVANLAKPIEIEELLGVVHCYALSSTERARGKSPASYSLYS